MNFDFVVTPEGQIEVATSDERSILVHALTDSLGTRPPRGAPQDGPSTYWIDRAATQLRERIVDHQPEPFASGNVTYMALVGDSVEVRYDYDPPDSP